MPEKQFVLIHQDGGYFSINDGSHWIRVDDPLAATVLSQTKANNILSNMIKPKERSGWSVQVWQGPDKKDPAAAQPPRKPSRSQQALKAQEEAEKKEKAAFLDEWLAKAEEMKHYYEALLERKQQLIEELRNISAELCDIEHYVEFTSLNASGGYRIYRMLKERLLQRRKIKDELLCISIFLKAEPRNILNGNLSRQIAGLGTREYGPRVLTELFDEAAASSTSTK